MNKINPTKLRAENRKLNGIITSDDAGKSTVSRLKNEKIAVMAISKVPIPLNLALESPADTYFALQVYM